MLTELRVRDLGVIGDLTVPFGPGMTALTGETGAGKTLLVEALHLLLGGRASPGLVRAGTEEALVEARFVLDGTGTDGEREVVVARAVPASGRSRAWVDGRMAPLAALADLAPELVDIHGQHEHQALRTPSAQRRALDAYAGCDLGPVADGRRRLRALGEELDRLGGTEHERAREADVLRHQVGEIAAAGLSDPAEDERLLAEEERLADLGAHLEVAAAALAALDPAGDGPLGPEPAPMGPGGALEALGTAEAVLAGRTVFEPLRERLRAAHAELDDVGSELRRVVQTWEHDPGRLEEVQQRRRLLGDLRRKYGPSLADVLAFEADARRRLDDLADAEGRAQQLELQRLEAAAALATAEAELHARRSAAAPSLAAAVAARLAGLAMPGARLEVEVLDGPTPEPVRIMLGANPGEPLQPLQQVASGGELARAMLALQLEVSQGPPTMVFDEVDAGVGGEAALALARALREVAANRQVLVVTHLAQVAAFADHHVAVRKEARGGRTVTGADVLDSGERVVEVSRMLSGHPDSATARAHAEELLTAGRSRQPAPPGTAPAGPGARGGGLRPGASAGRRASTRDRGRIV